MPENLPPQIASNIQNKVIQNPLNISRKNAQAFKFIGEKSRVMLKKENIRTLQFINQNRRQGTASGESRPADLMLGNLGSARRTIDIKDGSQSSRDEETTTENRQLIFYGVSNSVTPNKQARGHSRSPYGASQSFADPLSIHQQSNFSSKILPEVTN